MAGEVKATWFFNSVAAQVPVGWTETLWWATSGATLPNVLTAATSLAKARLNFLGTGYKISYVRVSVEGIFRDSLIAQLNYGANAYQANTPNDVGDFAYSILLLRMESGPLNRRSMYIGGIKDDTQQIDLPPPGPGLKQAMSQWITQVKASWSWFGLTKNAQNKAPKKVLNPTPPPKYTPRPMQLYAIDNVILVRQGVRKRGRPTILLRGRGPNL